WRPAARTTRRVADRLRQAAADVGIVDTEEDGVRLAAHRQVRDKGIVGVKNQLRVGIERCESVADSLGECVELEIAIHLVTKKIRDDDDARLELPDGAGQRRLVDLEEPEVAAWLRRPVRFRD